MPAIIVKNLSKTYRVHEKAPGLIGSLHSLFKRKWQIKQALSRVNLSIEPGEIVGLVGPNGAGKTTLMKILAGILHPDDGSVSVLGYNPWQRDDEFKRQISLIMGQKAQLWWDLPASDCFLLLKEIYRIPDLAYKNNLDRLSDRLGVTSILNIQVRRLSLGERMKMELIAALLHEPKIVFLDEPTIGLDISAQRTIRHFILEYSATRNPVIILTSHYMEDIEHLCKRIVLIRDGRLVYDGAIRAVLDRYATRKTISVRLRWAERDRKSLEHFASMFRDIGTIIRLDEMVFEAMVDRENIQTAASMVLNNLDVLDFSITDQDIGYVIEKVLKDDSTFTSGAVSR